MIKEIQKEGLDAHASVKLSQIGLILMKLSVITI